MHDVLMGRRAVVGEDAVAGVGYPLRSRDAPDRAHERRQLGRRRVGRKIIDRDVFAFWDHHDVGGRLRIDVAKREDMLVLVDLVARQFAAQDASEDIAMVVGNGGSRSREV